MTNRYRHTH